jgi:hypothetical protein
MKYGLLVISLVALIGILSALTVVARKDTPKKAEVIPMNEEVLQDVPREEANQIESGTRVVESEYGTTTIAEDENGISVNYRSKDGSSQSSVHQSVQTNESSSSSSSRVQSKIHISN